MTGDVLGGFGGQVERLMRLPDVPRKQEGLVAGGLMALGRLAATIDPRRGLARLTQALETISEEGPSQAWEESYYDDDELEPVSLQLARRGIGGLVVSSLLMGSGMAYVARIFSNDPVVIRQFVAIRVPMCVMLFFMNLSVFLEQVLMAMGRTRALFYAGFVGSWAGQVPSVALLYFWRQDLCGLYWGSAFGYTMACGLLAGVIATMQWEAVVSEAEARGAGEAGQEAATGAVERPAHDEQTALLTSRPSVSYQSMSQGGRKEKE